ncbi:hypothetical protein D3C87_1270890 [compost metagenome]
MESFRPSTLLMPKFVEYWFHPSTSRPLLLTPMPKFRSFGSSPVTSSTELPTSSPGTIRILSLPPPLTRLSTAWSISWRFSRAPSANGMAPNRRSVSRMPSTGLPLRVISLIVPHLTSSVSVPLFSVPGCTVTTVVT